MFVAPSLRAQQSAAGEPSRELAQTPQRLEYPPLFFREDWTLASGLPNTNTPQEPEHTVVQGDLATPNLEVHLITQDSFRGLLYLGVLQTLLAAYARQVYTFG